jgi:hypothetical protein
VNVEHTVPDKIAECDEEYVKNIEIVLPNTSDIQSFSTCENTPVPPIQSQSHLQPGPAIQNPGGGKTLITVENEMSVYKSEMSVYKSEMPITIESTAGKIETTVSQPMNSEMTTVALCKASKAQISAVVCQELLQSRAKTVRIGRVRWPPPLNPNETFESELQRYTYIVIN